MSGMDENLVSIPQLTKNSYDVNFVGDGARIVDTKRRTVFEAKKVEDDLYKIQGRATNDERACIGRVIGEDLEGDAAIVARTQKSAGTLNLWHRRLAHLNVDDVQSTKRDTVCEPCYQGKQSREPIPKETDTRATEVLYRIHSDLCEIGDSREGYRTEAKRRNP